MANATAPKQLVILASQSPRRAAILQALGVQFVVSMSDAEENSTYPEPQHVAQLLLLTGSLDENPAIRAWRKGNHIATLHPNAVILAADTIVVCDTQVLNKPTDAGDAVRMLQLLSGRTHMVHTGIALFLPHQQPRLSIQTSEVQMRTLHDSEIRTYVSTGEPKDKAGAYGIQGMAGSLVQAVQGSFTNVVGLPMHTTSTLLQEAGIAVPIDVADAYENWRLAHPLLRSELGSEP